MNPRSASIAGDQEAGGSSSFAWCNRQWLSSQALTRRSSVRPKQAVFNHNLLWLPESNGYPLLTIYVVIDRRQLRHRTRYLPSIFSPFFQVVYHATPLFATSYENCQGVGTFF